MLLSHGGVIVGHWVVDDPLCRLFSGGAFFRGRRGYNFLFDVKEGIRDRQWSCYCGSLSGWWIFMQIGEGGWGALCVSCCKIWCKGRNERQLVLKAQSTTKHYIRAEEDIHKEIYICRSICLPTFLNIYIYIHERTSKAEIRPEEQSEKAECCQENLW